jgi:hypothetical protein
MMWLSDITRLFQEIGDKKPLTATMWLGRWRNLKIVL